MGIWIFLTVCISTCLVIMFFDLYAAISFKRDSRNYEKYYHDVKNIITQNLDDIKNNREINQKNQRILLKRMKNSVYCAAFITVIKELKESDSENIQKYLCGNFEIAYEITKNYSKKSDRKKAFFAYVIFQMYENRICGSNEGNDNTKYVIDKLILFMQNPSIYVRENSFKALVKIANIDDILRGLRVLNYSDRFQNDILIENNLKITNNDHNELICRLMIDFDTFNEQIKIGIIKYMIDLKDKNIDQSKCYPRLLQIMNDKKTSKAVLAELIQYFLVYYYADAKKILIEILTHSTDNNARALAAISLQSYPSNETWGYLVENMKDENWYVRVSCVGTLATYGTEYDNLLEEFDYLEYRSLLVYFKNIKGLKLKEQGRVL